MVQEFTKGVLKPYGHVSGGYESVTSNFEFITITTAIDIRPTSGGGTFKSQACLNKLIEIVSLRGQPVIMGLVGGTASPFTLLLAIEHASAWFSTDKSPSTAYLEDPRSGEKLKDRIIADGINFGFGANVPVTYTNPATGVTGAPDAAVNDTAVLAVTYSATLI